MLDKNDAIKINKLIDSANSDFNIADQNVIFIPVDMQLEDSTTTAIPVDGKDSSKMTLLLENKTDVYGQQPEKLTYGVIIIPGDYLEIPNQTCLFGAIRNIEKYSKVNLKSIFTAIDSDALKNDEVMKIFEENETYLIPDEKFEFKFYF